MLDPYLTPAELVICLELAASGYRTTFNRGDGKGNQTFGAHNRTKWDDATTPRTARPVRFRWTMIHSDRWHFRSQSRRTA